MNSLTSTFQQWASSTWLRDSLILAVLYIATAKIGQVFSIPPGNVTPVWIPSGIILAAVLIRGYQILPGIFLGAFVGNVSAYIAFDSVGQIFSSVFSGLLNGTGDVLCAVIGAYAIEKTCGTRSPFFFASHVVRFVLYGAVVGSFVSALFGVTGLAAVGFVPWEAYIDVFVTWWTGYGVGVLIVTPLLVALSFDTITVRFKLGHAVYAIALIVVTATGLGAFQLNLGQIGLLATLPVAMWSVFRLDIQTTFASIIFISGAAVVATAAGVGVFVSSNLNIGLFGLQQFIALLSITLLTLNAVAHERATAQASLSKLAQELDSRVVQRTEDLEHARKKLEASETRLRGLIDCLHAGVVVHSPETEVTLCNPRAAHLLGIDRQAMTGMNAANPTWNFTSDNGERLDIDDYPVNQIIRERKPLGNFLLGIVGPCADITWVLANGSPILDENGELKEVIISFVDVTDLKKAQIQLKHAAAVFQSTVEGVTITDANGVILDVNPAFSDITGYERQEAIGRNSRMLKSGKHGPGFYQEMWHSLEVLGVWRGEVWNRKKDGTVYPELLTISTVRTEQQEVEAYIGVFTDISQMKQSQEHLDYLAYHDALTGLPNRELLGSHLRRSIKHARRSGSSTGLVFIDLDQFKSINDSLGHHVGDELLKKVAERLVEVVRDDDIVARLSGDEFVVLLGDLQEQESAIVAVDRIMGAFNGVFAVEGQKLRITASLGVSVFPQDADNATDLMRHADAAMYRVKDEGRNGYCFFTPAISAAVLEYARLGNALGEAVENEEFVLHYQPQVDLQSGKIVGVEALLRWNHANLGDVSPGRFIPIAEQSGRIRKIGKFVLQSACKQGVAWMNSGLNFGRISVNVSGHEFQSADYFDELERVIEKTGLPPECLVLELTESVLMKRKGENAKLLKAIRDLGIQVAIDDFGTGYSSLSYLSGLPIDKLKIDREFIRDILADENDAALTASIIAMSHALNLEIIAEGVETEVQAEFLRSHECRYAQGYLFGKPVAPDKVSAQFTLH